MIEKVNGTTQLCIGCKTLLLTGVDKRECVLCAAYRAGQIDLHEGMRFFVTEATVRHLQSYLAGDWIPSRIFGTYYTYERARQSVILQNLKARTRGNPNTFAFISSDRPLIKADENTTHGQSE